ATATYYKVTIGESIGGTVKTNIAGDKVMEGKKATFTAVPNEGWKFDTWIFGGKSGKSTADLGLDGSKATLEIIAECDIELTPTFVGDGTNTFQAEAGIIDNAINENTNAGFEGTGYINFGTGSSSVKIPVYVEYPGEYTMTMTYANGSGKARSLAIAAPGKCTAGIDGCKGADIISFDDTEKWTTYKNKETTITLPKGANYITFAIVDGNDGPNLDQITLTEKNVEKKDTSTIAISKILHKTATVFESRIYNTSGKLIRHSKGAPNLSTLPHGIYIVRTSSQGKYIQKLVHAH
ncbi:MAG: pectin esterase, partial [Fibrobacter sp.]|nr:pectin esterase [Fibrobacter sp.]